MNLSVRSWVIHFISIVCMVVIVALVLYSVRAEVETGTQAGKETGTKDIIKEGLVGWWGFDEDKGDEVKDKSGNGNHGKIFGAPQWVKGKIGSALQFDGENDWVKVEPSPGLDIKDGITIELWVKPGAADVGGLIWKGNHPYYASYGITKFYGWGAGFGLHFTDNKTPESEYFHLPIPDDKEWHHIAAVWNGKGWKLLVDGTGVNEGERPGTLYIEHTIKECLNIGGSDRSHCTPFKGIIDEVRIYNRGLKGSEIFNNYSVTQ